MISGRVNNRRLYDLPDRVLPRGVLEAPIPPSGDTARWLALVKLRQRRLVTLTRQELPLVAERVQRLDVPGCPILYCLRTDLPLLDESREGRRLPEVRLLAPLDPLIYDRRVTSALWGFDYVWEAYTPAHKRTRGHYALPVLSGLQIVGHIEPKADRSSGRLRVASRRVRRGHKVASAVEKLANFLGLQA